jgi:site-specific recombinase XerD
VLAEAAIALQQQELETLAADIDQAVLAENSRTAYESDWASFEAFCKANRYPSLPADPEHVRLYLAQLVGVKGRSGKKLRPKTAQRHLSAIVARHRAKALVFDIKHPRLQTALRAIRRRYGTAQERADALRTKDVTLLCLRSGGDTQSVRNKAILLLGFAGGCRRSELAAIQLEQIRFVTIEVPVPAHIVESDARGDPLPKLTASRSLTALRLFIPKSKGDQEAQGRLIGILPGANELTCPVAAVREWIRQANIEGEKGPLFRPVDRWSGVQSWALSDRDIDRIVRRLCDGAGLEGRYSAHSLRAGHVTEARHRGAEKINVRRTTGHKRDQDLDLYDREANLFVNNSSGMLGL